MRLHQALNIAAPEALPADRLPDWVERAAAAVAMLRGVLSLSLAELAEQHPMEREAILLGLTGGGAPEEGGDAAEDGDIDRLEAEANSLRSQLQSMADDLKAQAEAAEGGA